MFVECLVIFAIIVFLEIIFIATPKDRKYAVVFSPLLIPSGLNVLLGLFSETIAKMIPLDSFEVSVFVNIVGLIISCVMVGIFSEKFKNKSSKFYYLSMCIIFDTVLTFIIIYNLYRK